MVEHQPEQSRFVINVDSQQAVLKYEERQRSVDFTSTFVPDNLRGQGLAEKLVHAGLAWARAQGYTIEASCWYVKLWLDRGR
jgi:predicted GNAT family acetyltransferase